MRRQFLIPEDEFVIDSGTPFALSFKAKEFIGGEYGCRIVFNQKEKGLKNEIKFKQDVEIISSNTEFVVYAIKRHNDFFLNEKVPTDPNDLCLFESCQFIYPLEIKTNHFGSATEIRNYREIKIRWTEKYKDSLIKKFGPAIANKYSKGIQNVLDSQEKFENCIFNEWFTSLFFNTIYREYSYNFIKVGTHSYPLIPKVKPVDFKVKARIEKDEQYIRLFYKGEINDGRSLMDLSQNLDDPYYAIIEDTNQVARSDFKIQYLIHKVSHEIYGFQGLFNHNINGSKDIEISMYRLGAIKQIETENKDQSENKRSNGIFSKLFKW